MSEFEKQRTDLLTDIRTQYREMLLYRTIVHKMVAPSTVDEILYQSQWNEAAETWILPKFMDTLTQSQRNGAVKIGIASPPSAKGRHYQNVSKSVQQQIEEMDWNTKDAIRSRSTSAKRENELMAQQQIEDMDWSTKDAIRSRSSSAKLMAQQAIEQFDLSDLRDAPNSNEFEDMLRSKDVGVDDEFIQQITNIDTNQKRAFDDSASHLLPDRETQLNVGNDFLMQLSSINDAKPFKSGLDEPREELEFVSRDTNAELVDIASLMVEDKPSFADEMETAAEMSAFAESPEKPNASEWCDDDVLAQMMGGNRKPARREEEPNSFQQQRQDIDEGNFFRQAQPQASSDDYSVDVTELHKLLKKK